jgi:hypothetical protein
MLLAVSVQYDPCLCNLMNFLSHQVEAVTAGRQIRKVAKNILDKQ